MYIMESDLQHFVDDFNAYTWKVFFYSDIKNTEDEPFFTLYFWTESDTNATVKSVLVDSLALFTKDRACCEKYSPNNTDEVMSFIPYDEIPAYPKKYVDNMIQLLQSETEDISEFDGNFNGYVLFGIPKSKDSERFCMMVGKRNPFVLYRNAFSFFKDENRMKKIKDKGYYQLKQIFDVAVTNQNIFLTNTYGESIFGFTNTHIHNREIIHSFLSQSKHIVNFSNDSKLRKASYYTVIEQYCKSSNDLDLRISEILKSYDASNLAYDGLVVTSNGTIDCADKTSYDALLSHLAFAIIYTDNFEGKANVTHIERK